MGLEKSVSKADVGTGHTMHFTGSRKSVQFYIDSQGYLSVRDLLGAVRTAVEIEQHQDVALGILSETLFVVLGEGLS